MDGTRHFGSDHRVALGALAALTVAIFALSFLQFQKSVRAPFERKGPRYQSLAEREQAALDAQKLADTDKDTLSDYDELYLYRSSPYLDDTDSDGYPDGQEVASGNDPNCPAGTVCGAGADAANVQRVQPGLALPSQEGLGFVGSGSQILGGYDPETVRSLLRSAGVGDDVLSQIDDETLRDLYEQALGQVASSTATSTR